MKTKLLSLLLALAMALSFATVLWAEDGEQLSTNVERDFCSISDTKLSLFGDLEAAVLCGDLEGISSFTTFVRSQSVRGDILPRTVSEAKGLLECLDLNTIPVLAQPGSSVGRLFYGINFDLSEVSYVEYSLNDRWWLRFMKSGSEAQVFDVPDFVLKTSDGTEVPFFKNKDEDAHHVYIGTVTAPDGTKWKARFLYHASAPSSEVPDYENVGEIDFLKFSSLYGDGEDFGSSGWSLWLWIALPVGVGVIGGSAVILLRRKKRKAVAVE